MKTISPSVPDDENGNDAEQLNAATSDLTNGAQVGPSSENEPAPGKTGKTANEKVSKDAFDRLDELIVQPNSDWKKRTSKNQTLKLEKPSPQAIFRVSNNPDDHLTVYLLKVKEDAPIGDGYYLIQQSMAVPLAELKLTPQQHMLYSAIRRPDDTPFMIPARLPEGQNPRADDCAEAYLNAMALAQESWIRVSWDRKLSDYVVDEFEDDGSTPVFPEFNASERLRKMFSSSRLIDCPEHPAFLKLKGAA